MALINGTNYDHIDLHAAAGGDVTRHKLQDTDGRALVAPSEASSTASAAHATESYFIYGGVLYRATTAIAAGDAIVTSGSGQNCEAVTVGGEVASLNSAFNSIGFEEIKCEENIIEAQELTLTSTQSAMWYYDGTIHEDSAYEYYQSINQPISVTPGETYKFYGMYNQYTHAIIVLFDDNMQNAYEPENPITEDGGEYTIPSGYTKLCLSIYKSISLSAISIAGNVGTGEYAAENLQFTDEQCEAIVDNIPDNSIAAEKADYIELVADPDFEDNTNLLTGISWSNPGYYRDTNGQLVTNQYTTDYVASDFIPVTPGFRYKVTAASGKAYTLNVMLYSGLKNDGTALSATPYVSASHPADFTIPAGKTYISLNCEGNSGQNPASGLYRKTQLNNEKSIVIERLKDDKFIANPLKGKKIVNFGDSIYGQARPPYDVSTFLAKRTGATVYNAGFGGCQMSKHAQAAYDPFSMYRLAYAIANNDWSLQANAILNYPTTIPSYFPETMTMLSSLDFSEIDYITIGYGINDFNNGQSLEAQTTNGFKYCLDYSIQTLLTAFPNLRVFILTMTYGFDPNSTADTNSFTNTSWVDGSTHSYLDFIQAQYDAAKNYQLPVIDLYYDLGINKINKLQYFSSGDGVHQALAGRELIAEKIAHDLW